MSTLEQFLRLGGEIGIKIQNDKPMLYVSCTVGDEVYHKGIYYRNSSHLLACLTSYSDFLLAAITGLKNLKEKLDEDSVAK